MVKPRFNSLHDIQMLLQNGDVMVVDVVQHYLQRIKATSHLNAYVEVFEQEAMDLANRLDHKFRTNPNSMGKLLGCVVSIKDNITYSNHESTGGSKILKGFVSNYTASAIQNMLDEDAIIIGRTNCDEFGMGSDNTNSCYGPVKNGMDESKIPGGSSGGSAVSVQMDTCLVGIGTDTGGSIRQPAAMCGLYGYKPSYGMISRYGLMAYASSFDQLGFIANTPNDIDIMMTIASKMDKFDSTMFVNGLYEDQIVNEEGTKLKIAVLSEAFASAQLDNDIKETINQWISLHKHNKEIEFCDVQFDMLEYLIPCYYILTTAEASSNLSRYDGIRYGKRAEGTKNLEDLYVKSRTVGFGKEVKKRIMMGNYVLSEGYYDAYYGKAQKIRNMILQRINKIFETHDFLLIPTSTTYAWNIENKNVDPLAIYMSDVYTVLANLTGVPAMNIPLKDQRNKNSGIQILAKSKDDKLLISLTKQLNLA